MQPPAPPPFRLAPSLVPEAAPNPSTRHPAWAATRSKGEVYRLRDPYQNMPALQFRIPVRR